MYQMDKQVRLEDIIEILSDDLDMTDGVGFGMLSTNFDKRFDKFATQTFEEIGETKETYIAKMKLIHELIERSIRECENLKQKYIDFDKNIIRKLDG